MASSNDLVDAVDLHVGARIRLRRKLLGLSQHNLADHLGLTFQQVQKYESGANRVSASKLHDISVCLETSVGYFFEGLEGETTAHADRAAAAFLLTPEGLELAKLLPRVRQDRVRRGILDLVAAMAKAKDDAA